MSYRNPALVCALVASLTLAAPAVAAEGDKSGGKPQAESQSQAPAGAQRQPRMSPAQAEMMKIRRQLSQIQRETLKNNPELKKQGDELGKLVKDTMKEQGNKPDEHIAKLKELKKKFDSGELDQKQKQALLREAQSHQRELGKARRQAMQDEDVKQARKSYREKLLAAMKEQDPRTDDLLKKLREKRREMIRKQMKMRQQQPSPGGGMAPSGGN